MRQPKQAGGTGANSVQGAGADSRIWINKNGPFFRSVGIVDFKMKSLSVGNYAEGQRIRKAVGSTVDEYVYDTAGHQVGDMQPNGAMKRMEIYAGARHLATYDIASNATYFIHGDWQGTERVRTTASGATYESCANLPFGDGQQCSGGADISPMHFTGKPRDTETNLDYFGARYYSSAMARWMSPDWADKPTTVPYAQFGDPQSLNLYGYVTNNPVSKQDGDGHLVNIYQLYSWHSSSQGQMTEMIGVAGSFAQQRLDAALQNTTKPAVVQQATPAKPAQPHVVLGPQLSYTVTAFVTPDGRGGYQASMDVAWSVSTSTAGQIVQQVTFTDKSGNLIDNYWEAWNVSAQGVVTPSAATLDLNDPQGLIPSNTNDMLFAPSGTKVATSAAFYPGLQVKTEGPGAFVPGNKQGAGALPSTSVNPNLPNPSSPTTNTSPPVNRTWTAP